MIYQPSEDSFLLAKHVSKLSKGKSVIDIGSGSGIQAQTALKSGAESVLAVDINPQAIEHLKRNGISTLKSDLFSKVSGRYDLILFNPPYLPRDHREDLESQLATTGGKKGDEILLRFLKGLPKHMHKDSKILIILSSLTPKDKIISLLKSLKLTKKVIDKEHIFMETLELWLLKRSQ